MFGRDLGHDVYRRRVTWRWLKVRLWHLLAGDTRTGILYAHDNTGTAPTGPTKPSLTPREVGDWLDGLAETGKGAPGWA